MQSTASPPSSDVNDPDAFLRQEPASRGESWILVALVLAAFGPNIGGGLRVEQAVAYTLALGCLLLMVNRIRMTVAQLAVVGPFALVALLAAVTTLTVPEFGTDRALAMADNLAMPLAVAFVTCCVVTVHNRVDLLNSVARVVVVAMLINSVITAMQVSGVTPPLLSRWLPSGDAAVYLRAETVGRYTGILNQPALAGVLYGLALVLAIYLLRRHPFWMTLALVVLTGGALFAVSKAFFYVSLPVAVIYFTVTFRWRGVYLLSFFGLFGYLAWTNRESLYAAAYEAFPTWNGIGRFEEILSFAELDLRTVTGGRFGERSTLADGFAAITEGSPWFGFGLQGIPTAADSSWLLAYMLAGAVGIVLFAGMLAALAVGFLRRWSTYERAERHLFGSVVVIVAASSMAFPTVIGNRLAVVVWVLLMLMLSAPSAPERRRLRLETGPPAVR